MNKSILLSILIIALVNCTPSIMDYTKCTDAKSCRAVVCPANDS
jgi:hypothetical protein